MRTLVVGDIHGAARALDQVLERCGFDDAADRLIALGDVCDGWPEVDRCFDRLLGLRELTLVLGNHDAWALAWMARQEPLMGWYREGGEGTVESYARRLGVPSPRTPEDAAAIGRRVPREHVALLRGAVSFLTETDERGVRRLFAHAGWNPNRSDDAQTGYDLRLGRELWAQAQLRQTAGMARLTAFDEVYIGHTPTEWREPRRVLEIWNLDQGAGWRGVLTLMDVQTHEWWQSDPVPELYPGEEGRA